jgi:hypothetical protein
MGEKLKTFSKLFRRIRTKSPPFPEPENPFDPEQTEIFHQILHDNLITTMVALDENNNKQMDWCLAITGSILTAVIIAVSLHPTSPHAPLLPWYTRVFLGVLLLSSAFGAWAKLLMPGDKPEVVSSRPQKLEEMLERIRFKGPPFNTLSPVEKSTRREEIRPYFDYMQFHVYKTKGRPYTYLQHNLELAAFFFPFIQQQEPISIVFRKKVQFKSRLINIQLTLAFLGIGAIILCLICRIRI